MIISACPPGGNPPEDNFSAPVIVHGRMIRASADGSTIQIRTRDGWRVMRQVPGQHGKPYLRVRLPGGRTVAVHKLVALAWHGPAPTPDHKLVEHLDGNPRNNGKGNVRWATHSDNLNSALRLNERERWYPVKLNESIVYTLRTQRRRAEVKALADELGTGDQTVRDVFDNRTWRRVRVDQGRIPGTY